jgi:hypothetical protein
VYQATSPAGPDILKGLYKDITQPLMMLNNAINNALAGLGYAKRASIDAEQFGLCQGY